MSARIHDITRATALAHFDAAAAVNLPNGTFLVEDGGAYDHAHMRSGQLSSLLMLMRVDAASGFRQLGADMQLDLMWLASQLADELQAVPPLAAKEQHPEAGAAGRVARHCGGA